MSYSSPPTGLTAPHVADTVRGEYSANTATVLDAAASYQAFALAWTESTSEGMTSERILQRYALACIFYATNDVATTWTEKAHFIAPWVWDEGWLLEEDECSWYGVTCNANGFVESLDLSRNGLTGSFPGEIKFLKDSLVSLDLTKNRFFNEGHAELSWMGELTNLEHLAVAYNALYLDDTGLPLALKQLSKLKSLDVRYCLFAGEIADDFFTPFVNLEYLDIGGNEFTGPIPSSIQDLWSLKFLHIADTDLEGSLDTVLKSDLPVLQEIWANDNLHLDATIPPEIGNLSTLQSLNLANCNLSSTIPTEIGFLNRMEYLWLSGNKLEGILPSQLGYLLALETLQVEGNDLTGVMPVKVCSHLLFLETLGADCNSGEIFCPDDCCTCCGDECASA